MPTIHASIVLGGAVPSERCQQLAFLRPTMSQNLAARRFIAHGLEKLNLTRDKNDRRAPDHREIALSRRTTPDIGTLASGSQALPDKQVSSIGRGPSCPCSTLPTNTGPCRPHGRLSSCVPPNRVLVPPCRCQSLRQRASPTDCQQHQDYSTYIAPACSQADLGGY